MARPSKTDNIRRDEFEALLKIQCTCQEVCAVFHVSRQTLRKWVKETYDCTYEEIAEEYSAYGRMSLRRSLMNQADRNPAVAIFMAKNYLGMSDDPKPVDTGEARREFTAAIKAATKALEGCDLSRIADIPEPEGGSDGEDSSEA